MRNAVFVLAVALILVGLVARFTTDQATNSPPAAAKLGYVILESRAPQQLPVTAPAETTTAKRGEQKPMLLEAALAVASPSIASVQDTRKEPLPRPQAGRETTAALQDVGKALASDVPGPPVAEARIEAPRPILAEAAPAPGSVPPAAPVSEPTRSWKRPLTPEVSATNASPPPARPSPDVREAQALLARLGYHAGAADGIVGPQTQSAVLAYQAANALPTDGIVSAHLLARLRQDDTTLRASLSPSPSPPAVSEQAEESGWSAIVSDVSYRLDRLFGREFDSIRRPEQLRAHCRANREAWAYDSGRDKLIFCGTMNGITADNGPPRLLGH